MQIQGQPCISLFFSTARGGPAMPYNRVHLVQQIREVEHHFPSDELSIDKREEAVQLLAPLYSLLEDQAFWQHPDQGVAVLRSADSFQAYHLPFRVKEHVVVASHFYLKPLLPLFNDGSFYILAVSQNEIRLLEGTRYSIQAVAVPDKVPDNLAQALGYDHPDNQVRYHSSSSGGRLMGNGGRRAIIFYGQGIGIDEGKDDILRYFQLIDRGLHELLHDRHVPLVLAGVEYLLPLYRQVNTYPHLIDQGIKGNPELLSAETLHERAWSLVEPYVLKQQQAALAAYKEYEQTDRTSSNISQVVPAAYYGQVTDLFVALDNERWGSFDPATYSIEIHEKLRAGDDDLLDIAATQTVLHGGSVYALERAQMPGEALVAALFRYE
jgi:Bacterial archaeo-eukaryotic release factor family 7